MVRKPDLYRTTALNSMIKLPVFGCCLIILLTVGMVQNISSQTRTPGWIKKLEDSKYPEYRLEKANAVSSYSKYDFSSAIKPQSDFLGFIDPNYQRLKVYFDSVTKSKRSPGVYLIKGATVVKDNRCDFAGTIKLTEVREYRSMHYGVDDEYKSLGIRKQGVAIGTFQFNEDPKQKHVGIFEGTMLLYWYLDRAGKIQYDDVELGADAYRNNQYVSTWTQYGSKTGKRANWGEYRIPNSDDLDIGDGEFSVSPKYLDNGWRDLLSP
jgi:hypothetical protein